MILLLFLIKLFFEPVLINGTIDNVTDPSKLLQYLNGSSAYAACPGGCIGGGIAIAVFLVVTLALSFRIRITDAGLVGSLTAMVTSLLLLQMQIMTPIYLVLFIGLGFLFFILSVLRNSLHPFD